MKKKKLQQRIAELESQLRRAKSNEEIWKDMFERVIADLKGYGIKTEIIPAEPPVIEVSRMEDDKPVYAYGISTVPPTLSYDFTEHDKKVIYDFKRKVEEDNEPEDIKEWREFLRRKK